MVSSAAWAPCVRALRLLAALPSGVRGPVERRALARLAAIWAAVATMKGPPCLTEHMFYTSMEGWAVKENAEGFHMAFTSRGSTGARPRLHHQRLALSP